MLRAFHGTDSDIYAAETIEQAKKLCEDDMGEPCDEGYPRELAVIELHEQQPVFGEDDEIIEGEFTTIHQMLIERGDEPGWLCGSPW